MTVGWKTRLVMVVAAIAAWSLLVDAVDDHRWPGTSLRWWALFVAWFGGACAVWMVVGSIIRSRRERRDP